MEVIEKLYDNLREQMLLNPDKEIIQAIIELEYNLAKINLEAQERLRRMELDHEYKLAELSNNTEIYVAEMKYQYNYSSQKKIPSSPRGRIVKRKSQVIDENDIDSNIETGGEYGQEDIEFNELSGFGQMPLVNIGKVGKTTLTQAIRSKSAEIEPLWKSPLREKSQSKDNTPARIRTLMGAFLLASIASSRLDHWPNAPDSNMILTIKDEVLHRLRGYDVELIIPVFEFLKKYFKENYENTELENINTSLFSDFLDEIYIKQEALEVYQEDYNILNSPFAKLFRPHIDYLDVALVNKILVHYLETVPDKSMGKFVDIVIHHTEKYPNPKYETEEGADDWKTFFRENRSRLRRELEDIIYDIRDDNLELHKNWLAEREKFLEDFAK